MKLKNTLSLFVALSFFAFIFSSSTLSKAIIADCTSTCYFSSISASGITSSTPLECGCEMGFAFTNGDATYSRSLSFSSDQRARTTNLENYLRGLDDADITLVADKIGDMKSALNSNDYAAYHTALVDIDSRLVSLAEEDKVKVRKWYEDEIASGASSLSDFVGDMCVILFNN